MALKIILATFAFPFLCSFSVITGSLNCQINSNLHLPIMAANQERSFIMIKPDGVHRGLVGEIIKRFEQKGFKLVAMKVMQVKHNASCNLTNRIRLGFTSGSEK